MNSELLYAYSFKFTSYKIVNLQRLYEKSEIDKIVYTVQRDLRGYI